MLTARVRFPMTSRSNSPAQGALSSPEDYSHRLERATHGLLELTVTVLERMDKTLGLTSLRALQALQRRGPSQVTELANDLDMLVSTVSRLSDRLSEAGLITRRVSPTNRRATELELTDHGRQALGDLVTMRTAALREITDQMAADDVEALLIGTQAFTDTRARLNQREAGDDPTG